VLLVIVNIIIIAIIIDMVVSIIIIIKMLVMHQYHVLHDPPGKDFLLNERLRMNTTKYTRTTCSCFFCLICIKS